MKSLRDCHKTLHSMGPIELALRQKIEAALDPEVLDIENESHQHAVAKNSETHFKAVIVTDGFGSLSRIDRQRKVLAAIEHEMAGGVHAFTMRCLTIEEWKAGGADGFISPHCHGGSKRGLKR